MQQQSSSNNNNNNSNQIINGSKLQCAPSNNSIKQKNLDDDQQLKQYTNNNNNNNSSDSSSPSPTPSTSSSCYVDLMNNSQEYLNHIPSTISANDNLNNSVNKSLMTHQQQQQLTTNGCNNNNNTKSSSNRKSDSINEEDKNNSKLYINTNDDSLITERKLANNDRTISTLTGSPELLKKEYGSLKGSYKQLKENYLTEKKRITNDMLTIMRDENLIILADWLKIRNSLKNWIKLFVVLKPGILLLYKSDKMKSPGSWIGTILLNSTELLERPSKKHGFCFKLFHPLEKSIWASKGPDGESSLNVFLLPTFYLIFRATSEKIGNIWMDALELTMKSSNLIKRALTTTASATTPTTSTLTTTTSGAFHSSSTLTTVQSANLISSTNEIKNEHSLLQIAPSKLTTINNTQNNNFSQLTTANDTIKDNDIENEYFKEIDDINLTESDKNTSDDDCSLNSSIIAASVDNDYCNNNSVVEQTVYVPSPPEEFGELGHRTQTEEVGEENKSLIFHLVKQVRPGMDLSKVILPTFILEPRSFLEKLTDYYYHVDILNEAINSDDPYTRMKSVVKFYLSGFYKKPKGLKKPYNPILGEIFRCYWNHPNSDSKTFYIAEQVQHHPPITSFYVSNRKEGFCMFGTILARSKFYGNSVSAVMDGRVKLILLNRGEEYIMSMPYANCKGILIGKLTMELGGKVCIECPKTGYSAEIDFKLKPLLGGIEASNIIDGKIKLVKETIGVIHGKWDGEIYLHDKRLDERSLLWCPTRKVIEQRLKRYIVPLDEQKEFESEKVWYKVSNAIKASDQNTATEEKSKNEQKQREDDLERKLKSINYTSRVFSYDLLNKEWVYNYADLRPWDPLTDQYQYENDLKILTKTRHHVKFDINVNGLQKKGQTNSNNNHNNNINNNSSNSSNINDISTRHSHNCSNNEDTNVPAIPATTSYELMLQFNNLRYRLDQIETNLDKINTNLNHLLNKNNANGHTHTSIMNFFNNKNIFLIMVFILWSFGFILAILVKRLSII